MLSGFSRSSAQTIFTTIPLPFLVFGLFVLTGGWETRPELVPPPTSGFVGPSNRDKVIVFMHGAAAGTEDSSRKALLAQTGQPI